MPFASALMIGRGLIGEVKVHQLGLASLGAGRTAIVICTSAKRRPSSSLSVSSSSAGRPSLPVEAALGDT